VAGAFAPSSAQALASAGKRPVIGSMGSGAGGEITISAHIDPENLETSYELRLECGPEEPMACDELPNEHTQGRLPPVDESREVSMTVTGLKPGKYWFGASAVNADGEASWSSDILTVPEVPPGACPDGCPTTSEPYKPPELPWANESGAEAAAKTVQEQRAKEAAATKEQEEAKARAAAVLAAEAAALKQREEEEATAAATVRIVPGCVVPSLKGDTLNRVRRALGKAHCRLGKVSKPREHNRALIVSAQSVRPGRKLAHGAAVAVKLGPVHS
jgi:hypothetical protein